MDNRQPPSPPGAQGLLRRLLSGMGALGGSLAVWSLLQFLAVPVFTTHWGIEAYGQWLALSAATGFLSMLDMGLQVHLTSLIRIAAATGNRERIEEVIGEGLGLYAVLLAVGGSVLILAVFAAGLPSRLNLGPEAVPTALMLGASTLLLLPRGLVGCVFSARGQLSREVFLSSAQQILPLALQLLAVAAGQGMAVLAAIQLGVAVIVGWGALLAAMKRWHPDLGLKIVWPKKTRLHGYAAKAVLHFIPVGTTTLLLHAPVLLLQAIFPAGGSVVAFTTMRTFANLLRQIVHQMAVASGLEMTRQHAQEDHAGLARLFAQTSRAGGGLAGLLAGFMIAAGTPFFDLWTHGAVAFDGWLAAVFILTVLAMVPCLCAIAVLRHTDHAAPLARINLLQAVLGGGMLAVLIPLTGVAGAALAVNLSELLALGLPSLRHAKRYLGIEPAGALKIAWGVTLAGFASSLAIAWILVRLLPTQSLASLTAVAAVWAVPACLAAPFLMFDGGQRARLMKRLLG